MQAMLRLILLSILLAAVPFRLFAQNMDAFPPAEEEIAEEKAAEEEAVPQPLPTMVLEAHLVQIVLNDERRQGVDWEAIVSDFHSLPLKKEDNPAWADKEYRVSIGTVSVEDCAVLLDALDTVGQMTQTTVKPITLTADAKQSLDFSPANEALANIRVDVLLNSDAKGGTQLHVEPFVGVVLKDSGPSTAVTLKAQTDIALKENITIVIGGIISEQEISRTRKFPVLGSLPLLGLVFRSHGKLTQKTETVVFLTPRFTAAPEPKEEQ